MQQIRSWLGNINWLRQAQWMSILSMGKTFLHCDSWDREIRASSHHRHSPWPSDGRSSPAPWTLWGPSLWSRRWSRGSATCCALTWCAPQTSRSYCQTPKSINVLVSLFRTRPWRITFLSRPQIKHVFLMISSLLFFSVLRSAKVSIMTPNIRLRTIMMTTKKKSMS